MLTSHRIPLKVQAHFRIQTLDADYMRQKCSQESAKFWKFEYWLTYISACIRGTTSHILPNVWAIICQIDCRLDVTFADKVAGTKATGSSELMRDPVIRQVHWSNTHPFFSNRP